MNSIVQSSAIPGMIEPIEQDTLRQLAKDFEFNDQDTVVEFLSLIHISEPTRH